MTESHGSPELPTGTGTTTSSTSSLPSSGSTSDVAAQEAGSVAKDAKEGASHVVGVAKDETASVASDSVDQAKALWHQTRSELTEQAGAQQQRLAGGLRSLADELSEMASSTQSQGMASDLVGRVATQARDASQFLEGREPGSLLDELKGFARQRPGTFLAVAAGLGVIGGRISRSMADEHRDSGPATTTSGSSTASAADTSGTAGSTSTLDAPDTVYTQGGSEGTVAVASSTTPVAPVSTPVAEPGVGRFADDGLR
jgi:hypothetical protein